MQKIINQFEQCKYFVFSKNDADYGKHENERQQKRISFIAYLYYLDTLPMLSVYLNKLPRYIDVIIISSDEKALEGLRTLVKTQGTIKYILKPNVGRDISALLVTAKEYVMQSDYVCFVHDKKEHQCSNRINETELWVHNIWENTIASEMYMENIIGFFNTNEEYGVLTVPKPIGLFFDTWAGQGWYGSFEATKALAELLKLNVDITESIPPVTIGTALWFRSAALKKLFDFNWDYTDFNDERLCDGNYLSYAVERIFSYVAEDAGYKTGIIMTNEYAAEQTLCAQNLMSIYVDSLNKLLGVTYGADCLQILNKFDELKKEVSSVSDFYLYGAGKWGKVCLKLLRLIRKEPKGFAVTKKDDYNMIEGVPVMEINNIRDVNKNLLFIVTVSNPNAKKEIITVLKEKGFKYFCFWE